MQARVGDQLQVEKSTPRLALAVRPEIKQHYDGADRLVLKVMPQTRRRILALLCDGQASTVDLC